MSIQEMRSKIIRKLSRLGPTEHEAVLGLLSDLEANRLVGTPGRELIPFAGSIDPEDLSAMEKAIEVGCEKVDASEW